MANSWRYAKSKQYCAGIPFLPVPAVGSSAAACKHPFSFSSSSQNHPQIQEIAQKLEYFRRHLNVEVVDDTALIDTFFISKNNNPKPPQQMIKKIIKSSKPNRNKPRNRKDWKIKKEKAAPLAYSRPEMVALRSQNLDRQRTKWSEVYGALAAPVAAEYDGLVAAAAAGGGPRTFGFYRRSFIENKPALNIDGAAMTMEKGSPLKISVH